MSAAYRGRAAAYIAQNDYERALADQDRAVALFALSPELFDKLGSATEWVNLLETAAEAYRERAKLLEATGRTDAARFDRGTAQGLVALAQKPLPPPSPFMPTSGKNEGWIILTNHWSREVVIVLEGVPYTLPRERRQVVQKANGAFTFEVLGIQGPVKRYLEPGRPYEIEVYPK
jgi:tetratricopeptide (TPR) repeat protein